MDLSAEHRSTYFQQRLEDAGFTRPESLRLAHAAAGDESGDAAARVTAALDELQFPAGPSAERRRARLWQETFPGTVGGAPGDAPEPGWYTGPNDGDTTSPAPSYAGVEHYWDGRGWTGRRVAPPARGPVPDSRAGTVLTIVGFCLGVVALAVSPLVPGSLAIALASVIVAAIGLGSPAVAVHGGVRALGTAGLVLGIIALVQTVSVTFLPAIVGTPFGVVVP